MIGYPNIYLTDALTETSGDQVHPLILGVIKNSLKRDIEEIDIIFKNLKTIFSEKNILKSDIVNLLKKYLPNFNHIETGKNLDSKM